MKKQNLLFIALGLSGIGYYFYSKRDSITITRVDTANKAIEYKIRYKGQEATGVYKLSDGEKYTGAFDEGKTSIHLKPTGNSVAISVGKIIQDPERPGTFSLIWVPSGLAKTFTFA